jgi:hypothetical protein
MNPKASFGDIPFSFARGIIRLTLQTSSRLVGMKFEASLITTYRYYYAALVISEFH